MPSAALRRCLISTLVLGSVLLPGGCRGPRQPDAQIAYDRANQLLDEGKTEEAIRLFRQAIRLKPDFADAYYELGSALELQGKWQEAIVELSEAVRLRPDDDEAHYNLGHAFLEQGDLDASIRELCAAIRLRPDFANSHVNLGRALDRKKQHEKAVAAYRKALRLAPKMGWLMPTSASPWCGSGSWRKPSPSSVRRSGSGPMTR